MNKAYKVVVVLNNSTVDTFYSDTSFSADYGMITWQIDDYKSITYPVASIHKIEELLLVENE